MAIVSPFRAWRYDPERVPIQQVVTQPYDKITPAMQERYYQSSPYDLVRIILGKRPPGDGDADNVYTRAAAAFQNWRHAGILRQDPEPSIYRYSQTFRFPEGVPGGVPENQPRAERRGFIALGRIEPYSAGVVFRHEQTLAQPKADRLDLLRATGGHFGAKWKRAKRKGASGVPDEPRAHGAGSRYRLCRRGVPPISTPSC
jgi:uncharacterized protein (DUF1015 family)